MLVGARPWQDTGYHEQGRFARCSRIGMTYQINTLLQQGFRELDSHKHPVAIPSREEETSQTVA